MATDDDVETPVDRSKPAQDFQSLSENDDPSIVREFIDFLRTNKKWWLAPILITMLLLVGLAFLSASPAAPFIYSLF